MNQLQFANTQLEHKTAETLSFTTDESHFLDLKTASNGGFNYMAGGNNSIKPGILTKRFQAPETSQAYPSKPCTFQKLQEIFRDESTQIWNEELQNHALPDTPIKDLAMSIENNIRQQFIQMIPDLLKSLQNHQNSNSLPLTANSLDKVPFPSKVVKEEPITNFKMLNTLSLYLSKLLKGEPICHSHIEMTWIEKVILASIINKKYKHKSIKKIERINDMTPEFLLQFPLSISQGVSLKRTEENYKIVFNWCFKFLKKKLADQLANEKQKPLCKKELEDFFYNYYFKKVADEKEISITKFYKPNFTNKLQNVEKTFNTHFMSHIQLSPLFMADFNHAMNTFISMHIDLIDKKLRSLFLKWEEMLSAETNTEETLRTISNYIMKSSKCKLPWSRKEIEVAHKTVINLFK
jgi:hypothetical protein